MSKDMLGGIPCAERDPLAKVPDCDSCSKWGCCAAHSNQSIAARDKWWVAGVKELIYGCYSGNCKHKLTCSVHSFSCQAFEQLKKNMGVL
jgi:hypothetical protein